MLARLFGVRYCHFLFVAKPKGSLTLHPPHPPLTTAGWLFDKRRDCIARLSLPVRFFDDLRSGDLNQSSLLSQTLEASGVEPLTFSVQGRRSTS